MLVWLPLVLLPNWGVIVITNQIRDGNQVSYRVSAERPVHSGSVDPSQQGEALAEGRVRFGPVSHTVLLIGQSLGCFKESRVKRTTGIAGRSLGSGLLGL